VQMQTHLPENPDGHGGLSQRPSVFHLPQGLRPYSGRVAGLSLILHGCNWKTNATNMSTQNLVVRGRGRVRNEEMSH